MFFETRTVDQNHIHPQSDTLSSLMFTIVYSYYPSFDSD